MKNICKVLFCISVLALLLVAAGCGKTEYSVKEFANVTVIGYTEHGSLSIKVDDAAVNRIYADGKKDKTAAIRFGDSFRFTYEGQNEEDSYFTNGDVVTINVTYDERMAKDLGISFIDSSFEYTIEGLEDKVTMSPFEGLSVKFSGVAPYGTVQIDKSNCIQYVIDNVTFYCDNHDLSNGDKVVVRAEFNPEIAERSGYVFTEDVKKFTVVGLSKYVTTMMGVTYSGITARMHYMVEQYVSSSETSYKSLKWYFGEEDSDSDSDEFWDEESDSDFTSEDEETEEDDDPDEENLADDNSDDSDSASSGKKKRKSDVQRIKEDFVLSDFKAKFEYTPIECYYALNPLQYSDNIFIASYKIKGTFVCESTSGSGYIKPGDTVVGELYLTASLTGGGVDIKNNLVYENTTLENAHSYSIRNFPEYSDLTADVYKSTTYVVEMLTYVEDQDVYEKFAKDIKGFDTRSAAEQSHITIPSSSDSDSDSTSSKKRRSSSEGDTSAELGTDTELYDTDSEPIYYDDGYDYDEDDGGYDDGYDDGYGYDYEYDEDGYDYY